MLRVSAILLFFAALSAAAQTPTAEQVRDLQAKFQTERASAKERHFAETSLALADKQAARAETALAVGNLRDAAESFRAARWLLPALSNDLPANLSRVYGDPRL